jgi:hypothetical protein
MTYIQVTVISSVWQISQKLMTDIFIASDRYLYWWQQISLQLMKYMFVRYDKYLSLNGISVADGGYLYGWWHIYRWQISVVLYRYFNSPVYKYIYSSWHISLQVAIDISKAVDRYLSLMKGISTTYYRYLSSWWQVSVRSAVIYIIIKDEVVQIRAELFCLFNIKIRC